MEKAYDIGALAKRLEGKGVKVAKESAEAVAGIVYQETKAWLKESAALSENKIDDVVAPFYDQLDPVVLPQIDKIDGEVG